MKNGEVTLFIAKSLSIPVTGKNLGEIIKVLKSEKINWDLFVKISTSQMILPALYCNYKKKQLLHFLPNDLVIYMKEITSLNRERNLQITKQIFELNTLLKQYNINPIFIKGSGNLIKGLYEDPAERMIGDIDFLVSKNKYDLVSEILLENNYKYVSNLGYHFPQFKHHPRLYNEDSIAAVEIHKELVTEKYASEFNYHSIKNNIIQKNGFFVLSYDDQKALSIFSNQINDYGFRYKTIGLKNAYDFILLNSKKTGTDFNFHFNKLRTPIMYFIASVNYMFGELGIDVQHNRKVEKHLQLFKSLLHSPKRRKLYSKIIYFKISQSLRFKIILRCFVNKEYRAWILKRILDKQWQKEKLVQLGLKKPINN
ncbi:MAG: nucleotidyltransferase family protein [Bacteroidota bacterium]|nr:nucleotidyltransferase family protein [Bacteroidota bacterium]